MAIITLQSEIERKRGIRYQFDSATPPIGEGGMGRVFEGVCVDEHTKATRPVAIKFMFDDLPPSAYERARRESEIQLRNDNLVEMLGFIETEERTSSGAVLRHCHVVSELLTGISLSDVLQGKTKGRDGEDIPFAVKMLQDYKNDSEHFARIIVMNVLSGLMALHDAGYIHRDIDPSNIMLTNDGHIKLIDFGIAKQIRSLTTGDKALTVAGKFMGKPEYAAPELVLGDIDHQNQTTDIYAVGILLYQCIVGHTPFEGARHEVLEQQLHSKLNLKLIKNRQLKNIIATACERKQEARYQTSAQMRVALEAVTGSKPVASKKKVWIILATTLAIVAVLLGAVIIVKHKQTRLKQEAQEQAAIVAAQHQRQEANNAVQGILANAERLVNQGLEKLNEDEYELSLMSAFVVLEEAESLAQKNISDYSTEDIALKKSAIIAALDSAQSELSEQAKSLIDMGEHELAKIFLHRKDSIETFKNSIE